MAATHETRFVANPTQKLFIASRAEADLFDCRKGEGKSAALAWACFYHTRGNPGAEWLLIRDTWENCRRTTQREFFKWFPPQVFGEYRAGDKEYIWGERTGIQGRVTFIGLDAPEDAHKVASMPLAGFGMDEPAPAAGESEGIDEFVFDTAMAQLRQPGMKWYAAKLAQNNPDETHWTYRKFWEPGTPALSEHRLPLQEPGFRGWRSAVPENVENLPPGYYERMAGIWAHRPDLLRRFVEGKAGFQQVGKSVTPEWSDELHLTSGLKPIKGIGLHLLWDFGLNPTCIITQVTPLGAWHILEAHVGDGIGTYELIEGVVKPRLAADYAPWLDGAKRQGTIQHIGDPAGDMAEQSSSRNSAVRVIRQMIGGTWRPGPRDIPSRVDPLRSVLRRVVGGSPPQGIVQVDREKAKPVWHALRGGWHYHVARTGVVGEIVKDHHCVDIETEILTADGFKRFDAIAAGDETFGFDLESRKLVPDRIRDVNVFDGEFNLLTFKSRAIDMAVTPNHRVIAAHGEFHHGGPVRWNGCDFIRADALNTAYAIPHIAGEQVGKAWRRFSDEFVRLCAWVMTEGYYRQDGSNEIWITQCREAHPDYCDQLARLTERFGGCVRQDGANIKAVIGGETAWLIRELMPLKAPSQRFIAEMRTSERLLFLFEALKGDGIHRNGTLPVLDGNMNRKRFWSLLDGSLAIAASKSHEADAIQQIALRAGLNSRNFGQTQHHSYHRVSLKQYRSYGSIGKMERGADKTGRVWCPTTLTGTWIARRNGTVFCTGNSHPGDSMGYGAAILFPMGKLAKHGPTQRIPSASYFNSGPTGPLGFERPGLRVPPEARVIR